MLIQPNNFTTNRKFTLNPRRLEEGIFVEFNYKKRDGSSSQYEAIVLDVYPPGGYIWALKLIDMRKSELKRMVDKLGIEITEQQGQDFQKLDVETGKQSYKMVQNLRLENHYRKFIMSEMSLVRIRPIDFNSLI